LIRSSLVEKNGTSYPFETKSQLNSNLIRNFWIDQGELTNRTETDSCRRWTEICSRYLTRYRTKINVKISSKLWVMINIMSMTIMWVRVKEKIVNHIRVRSWKYMIRLNLKRGKLIYLKLLSGIKIMSIMRGKEMKTSIKNI